MSYKKRGIRKCNIPKSRLMEPSSRLVSSLYFPQQKRESPNTGAVALAMRRRTTSSAESIKNFSLNKIQFNLIQTRKNALSYLKGLTGRIFAKGERPHQLAMVRLTNQTP